MKRNEKGQFSTKHKKTFMKRVTKEEKEMIEHIRILEQFVDFLNSIAIEDRLIFEDAIKNFCEFNNLSYEENKYFLRNSLSQYQYTHVEKFFLNNELQIANEE